MTCELPRPVAVELENLGRGRSNVIWTGGSRPETVATRWNERLAQIIQRAGVNGFRTHRLRDTFDIDLLLADVSIEDVTAQTTERYYAPWDRSRPDRLTGIVRTATSGTRCSRRCTGIPAKNWARAATVALARAARFNSSAQAHDFRRYTAYLL